MSVESQVSSRSQVELIQSMTKDTRNMVSSFYCPWEFPNPSAMFRLYKSHIKPKMEHCYYTWIGDSQPDFPGMIKIKIYLQKKKQRSTQRRLILNQANINDFGANKNTFCITAVTNIYYCFLKV